MRHLLVGGDNLVESVSDFAGETRPRAREPYRKVSIAHGLEAGEDRREISGRRLSGCTRMPIVLFARLGRSFYGRGGCVTVISFHGLLLVNEESAVPCSPMVRKMARSQWKTSQCPCDKSALRQISRTLCRHSFQCVKKH